MFPDLLRQRLAGIADLSSAEVQALEAHYLLLERWNRSLNLTSIERLGEIVERHYCESIFLGTLLPSGSQTIVDVGSGPGFPGFPIAILRPECAVTLVESHQRKAVFLREASRKVPNIRVLSQRAEDLGGEFAWMVSRAVSYRDLMKPLRRLARNGALLTGPEAPPDVLGFEWATPIPVPWGEHRLVRIGQRRDPPRLG